MGTKRDHPHLRLSVVADRLLPRIRFAVSREPSISTTAMLITRIDGMVSYAFGQVA